METRAQANARRITELEQNLAGQDQQIVAQAQDRDIKPIGQIEIARRADDGHMTDVYGPNGKLMGSLTTERAAILQTAFCHPYRM